MTTLSLSLVLALAGPAAAQERAPELPSMSQFRATLKDAPRPPLAVAAAQAQTAGTPAAAPVLPANFTLYEKFFTIMDALELKSGNTSYGRITQRFWAWSKAFYWDDPQGRRIANARARILALGSTVDVTDAAGHKIGTIKEEILKSLFKIWTTYKILDPQGRQLASSAKIELFSTEITLKRPDGRAVALLRRGFKENFLRLTDRWDVTVQDASAVDPRMLVMIAAFKTSVDNDRAREAADDDDKRESSSSSSSNND
ncbi:MAG: hypothetical protein HY553_15685 [Elusimicrobia bacterium]|nr:hypothetical protein [Elusimicrobiota bacterium]